jgi:uncharacterized membrane protein
MAQRRWATLLIVVGGILAVVSAFADPLGVGGEPGFGWKQTLGLIVGVVLAIVGVWRRSKG